MYLNKSSYGATETSQPIPTFSFSRLNVRLLKSLLKSLLSSLSRNYPEGVAQMRTGKKVR